LLERLLRRSRPGSIVFSAFGLREGYVFSRLPATLRRQDPLLAAAHDQADRDGRFGTMGLALEDWTRPLFSDEDGSERRLRYAVCMLSDIAWRDHPDYRAEQAFTRILRLPIGGIEHGERVFAAAAVAARYAGSLEPVAGEAVLRLIDEPRLGRALVLGLALRLAYSLSGATPTLLKETSLRMSSDRLTLSLPKDGAVMYGEAVNRRLEALGRAVGRSVGTATATARTGKSS
jgi:exopolyphosphatase / guanosine-5'-triphosphate,3'-diphosphate pyrophosphatase